jgi:hypothetical protein
MGRPNGKWGDPTKDAARSYAHAARTLAIRIRPQSPGAHPASVPIIERSFTGLLARAGSGLSEGRCLVAYR